MVGVADRGPTDPTPIGQFVEFLELFGAGSRYTMPEVRTAFANGISPVFMSRIAAGRGQKATLVLRDEEAEGVVKLKARAEGAWGGASGFGSPASGPCRARAEVREHRGQPGRRGR